MPKLIKPHSLVCSINDHAFRHGVRIVDLLRRAQVAQSTWMRWRQGAAPNLATLDKLHTTLDQIIAEDELHGAQSGNEQQEQGRPAGR